MTTPAQLMRDLQIMGDPEIESTVDSLMSSTPESVAAYFFPTPAKVIDPVRMSTQTGETPRQAYVLAALLQRLYDQQPLPIETAPVDKPFLVWDPLLGEFVIVTIEPGESVAGHALFMGRKPQWKPTFWFRMPAEPRE